MKTRYPINLFFLKKELSPVEFSVQQDIYDGEIIEAKEDFVHGNFEVVPGVSADEYIQRFKKGNNFQTLTHSALLVFLTYLDQKFHGLSCFWCLYRHETVQNQSR